MPQQSLASLPMSRRNRRKQNRLRKRWQNAPDTGLWKLNRQNEDLNYQFDWLSHAVAPSNRPLSSNSSIAKFEPKLKKPIPSKLVPLWRWLLLTFPSLKLILAPGHSDTIPST